MGSHTGESTPGSVDSSSEDLTEGTELLDQGGLEIEGELNLGNRRNHLFPVLSGSGQKKSATIQATRAAGRVLEQRDRCNSTNFTAASPLGSDVRPCSMSETEDWLKPTSVPISAKVIPLFPRRSVMSDAHAIAIRPSLREPVGKCQRHPITEFRDNLAMSIETFGERVKRFRGKRSRRELAAAAGITYSTLADIENNGRNASKHLKALAAALKVAPRELLGGDPQGDPVDVPPPQAAYWPFAKVLPQDINDLDRIERSHIERAMQDALDEIKTERRRHRRSG